MLEKAFAKLHGCYESLDGGTTSSGMVDLTGGVQQKMKLTDKAVAEKIANGEFWARLKSEYDRGDLLGVSNKAPEDPPAEEMVAGHHEKQGIMSGHAYGIIGLREAEGHKMVRLRNPWGNKEWDGKWGDEDKESWTESMMQALNKTNFENDGCFWMEVCTLSLSLSLSALNCLPSLSLCSPIS